ncbi:ECF transporter S component [Coprococcus eutactus]|uniref:ECF transporter S component n=1 Tax=Coprococcus eutactus TaxID=33043 RepID=UPI0011CC509D|nr:ECF transporter S component [Coprococcus eutactus]MCB6630410.1 ATP-binding cassette domain-containing protein [Coprococcus eutactus]MCG4790228.1 ATP-binding cassette domain-containing protein [Coprococcus eutactus]MCQ5119061.1 ATP-binding cassette domain-containing protein [Coprococcus eutactus]MCQ5133013.1 ATP-binding cassette domain-containing protein [Coprococcus eutactus]MCQ5136040.1 ATP-binding cassette domain-containing protein [Coprococcus eutactus]
MDIYKNIFDIDKFSFAYPDGNDESGRTYLPDALRDTELHVRQGEFVVILGRSGCGKTTLLRQLKPSVTPVGKKKGQIIFDGKDICSLDDRMAASQIGFVWQDVNAQLVTDKVWHELAFGLESLGYDNGYVRRRVAEMGSFFGLGDIFHRKVMELSGGQKQLVNLASVMAMSPKVLVLDEPTSQLDPIAANDFINSLVRINRELGTTIIMTEHRLEDVLPVCNRSVVMENGRIIYDGDVRGFAESVRSKRIDRGLYLSMPASVQIYMGLEKDSGKQLPLTVPDAREWLVDYDRRFRENGGAPVVPEIQNRGADEGVNGSENQADNAAVDKGDKKRGAVNGQKDAGCREEHPVVCSLDEVSFRYERNTGDVLRQVSLDIYANEILMINGSNGCGKSTMLSLIANLYSPYSGKLHIAKNLRTGMLPQNPELLFTRRSVRDELIDAKDRQQLAEIVRFCRLEELLDRHPYDLSGGEKQRLGLAKVLIADPDILLMDEPTKGLDNGFKMQLADMLRKLQKRGKTIVVVSHDIEFCAVAGDRVALLFDGEVAMVGDVRSYMSDNNFFTTAASRISRNILDGAVTVREVLAAYGADMDVTGVAGGGNDSNQGIENESLRIANQGTAEMSEAAGISDDKLADIILNKDRKVENLSIWQIVTIAVTTVIIIFGFWNTMSVSDLSGLVQQMTVTAEGRKYLVLYGVMIAAILGLLVAIRPITQKRNEDIVMDSVGHGFGKRTVVSIVAVLVLIPATIWFGVARLGDKKYFFISLLVLLEAMLPFFVSFEDRKPKVRDIVTLAVMCALAVTGRTAFFMLPNFTPVMAIVIIAGVAFGCEGGFITGAMTMFVSNFIMGQGPWTPWQMFAMGLVGFLAGLFFAGSSVRTRNMTKLGLCIFGALICIVVYGGIMNPASVIMWQPNVNFSMIMASYVTGFPFDLAQATATVIALWLVARPFLEKLDRVRIKFGVLK